MTTHCSILAWEIPWTEEPGGLQSMGLQRADKTEVTWHACNRNVMNRNVLGGLTFFFLFGHWKWGVSPPHSHRNIKLLFICPISHKCSIGKSLPGHFHVISIRLRGLQRDTTFLTSLE